MFGGGPDDRASPSPDHYGRIWFLERLGPQHRIAQPVMFALKICDFLGPQRADTRQRLVKHLATRFHIGKRDAAHGEFRFRPPGSNSCNQTSAADVVKRGQGLRHDYWMTEQVVQHQMADTQFTRRTEQHRCRSHRVQVGFLLGVDAGLSEQQVVAQIKGGVSSFFRGLSKCNELLERKTRGIDAEIHYSNLSH